MPTRSIQRVRLGFTLIEVMIAIAIVVVLVGIVAVNVMGRKKEADTGTAKIALARMSQALDEFKLVFDRYPSDDEGLTVLWDKSKLRVDNDQAADKWRKFVTQPSPNDPWGRPWNYRAQSEHGNEYDLWSVGPDGQDGNADDVANWSGDQGADGGSSGSGTGGRPSGASTPVSGGSSSGQPR
ncbi:MAG: type II secretion system major pseudopilin GspG [Phycisphaerales bacterium]|nr:type II secretion system major pseudopilin GspG [Phycisphaerales bacterium]